MPTEIERKFLVTSDAWREEATDSYAIRQGYLARTETCTVRIRITESCAMLTIKSAQPGLSRSEYEYEIPADQATEMLATLATGRIIEKRRHHVRHGRHLWEVDEFSTPVAGLVLAEVELEDPDEQPDLPDWLGEEVTGDWLYTNAGLSAPEGPAEPNAQAERRT